jgi:hypothetical protein
MMACAPLELRPQVCKDTCTRFVKTFARATQQGSRKSNPGQEPPNT